MNPARALGGRKLPAAGWRHLALFAVAAATLLAGTAQAVEITYEIGPSGVGTLYERGDAVGAFHTVIPLGSLPANSYLTSISIDTTLLSTDCYNWPAELIACFDPTPLTPGSDSNLQIGPFIPAYGGFYYDYGAVQKVGWSRWPSAYNDPVSSMVEIKSAGTGFLADFDLSTTQLFLVNGASGMGTGGNWSGTLKINYQVAVPPAAPPTWTPTAAGTYDWNDTTSPLNNWGVDGAGPNPFPNAQNAVANLNIQYAGNQTINLNQVITVGTIRLGDKGYSKGITIAGNGGSLIMDVSSGSASIGRFYAAGTKDTISADIVLNSDLLVSDATGELNDGGYYGLKLSGNITGGKKLTKAGAGAVILTGTNDFSSVTVEGGYLAIGNADSIGSGTLTINDAQIEGVSGAGGPGSITLTNNNPIVLAGNLSSHYGLNTGTGSITLTKAGLKVINSIVLGGPVSGPDGLNAFDLTYEETNGIGTSGEFKAPITIGHAGQTAKINGWGPMWSELKISGAVGDDGNGYGLKVTSDVGAAKLLLAAANTYSGDTEVASGSNGSDRYVGLGIGHNLALQNSALVVDHAQMAYFGGGVTTPTIGGLKGDTDLASAFANAGYAWVTGNYDKITSLTLNPLSGTCTYSGKIADGAAGMTLIKTGAGTQVLSGANTYTGGVTVGGGTLTLGHEDAIPVPAATTGQDVYVGDGAAGAKLVIASGLPKAVQVRGLSMHGGASPTGTVDLQEGQLLLDGTVTSVANVTALVASGYNPADPDNPWKGPGITSSTAAAAADRYAVGVVLNGDYGELAFTSWFGRTVNNDSVLVRFTYQGDCDLSGEVTTDDFDNWKQGYITHLTGWLHGDLDYSGDISTDDFDLWKQVYVKHYAPLPSGAGGAVSTSAVPEPGTLVLLVGGLGLALLLRRRPATS